MALVNNDYVPRLDGLKCIDVTAVGGTMDTRNYSGILQRRVTVAPCNPQPKGQSQPLELTADVSRKTSRRQIQNAQPGLPLEKFSKYEASLNRLSKPHFVSDEYSLQFR